MTCLTAHMTASSIFVFSDASGTYLPLASFASAADAAEFVASATVADEINTGETRDYLVL